MKKNYLRSKRKVINKALFVIECEKCGTWLASSSELNMLPNFSTCTKCMEIDNSNSVIKNSNQNETTTSPSE